MFTELREKVKGMVDERLTLVGDAWLALDVLQSISQSDLHPSDIVRIILLRDSGSVYYVRPGFGVITMVEPSAWVNSSFNESEDVELWDVPSLALSELLRLSLIY